MGEDGAAGAQSMRVGSDGREGGEEPEEGELPEDGELGAPANPGEGKPAGHPAPKRPRLDLGTREHNARNGPYRHARCAWTVCSIYCHECSCGRIATSMVW